MGCGCCATVLDIPTNQTIEFCPLHEAAPELLEACKAALAYEQDAIVRRMIETAIKKAAPDA